MADLRLSKKSYYFFSARMIFHIFHKVVLDLLYERGGGFGNEQEEREREREKERKCQKNKEAVSNQEENVRTRKP